MVDNERFNFGFRIGCKMGMNSNIFLAKNKIQELCALYKDMVVAYSGGVDSHVLLDLVRKNCMGVNLIAVHVNHNVSSKSESWSRYCQKTCKELDVECVVKGVNIKEASSSFSYEEALRNLRYDVFAKLLPKDACLLTAHHADDQAETVLLQLFRGSGVKGLSAMPEKIKFSDGWLARPLLNCSREEILQYANENKLNWIEDESNLDTKFNRNFVRHELAPMIQKKWSGVVGTLNRVARHCAETSDLLENLAEMDLQAVVSKDNEGTLDAELLKSLSFARQKNVLRFWLCQRRLTMPSEAKLNEIVRTILCSRYDAAPVVKWSNAEMRRFRRNIYVMAPLSCHDNCVELTFDKENLELPADLGVLTIRVCDESDFDRKKMKVRFRQGGEKLNLYQRKGTRLLKKLMQEWNIPPWLRDRIPLVYCEDEIIAVVGFYCADGVSIKRG